jgi:hypothetical protein
MKLIELDIMWDNLSTGFDTFGHWLAKK